MPGPLRGLEVILAAAIALFLQAPDTLAPATAYAVKELPVVRATEAVQVDTLVQAPRAVADLLRVFTGVQVKDYCRWTWADSPPTGWAAFPSITGRKPAVCKPPRSTPAGRPCTWSRPCLRFPAGGYGSGAAPWAA